MAPRVLTELMATMVLVAPMPVTLQAPTQVRLVASRTRRTLDHTTYVFNPLSFLHHAPSPNNHPNTPQSNLANKADPRVDSDLDGRGNRHGASTGASAGVFGASGSHATAGSGTAQNTAGPHNSDALNKIDPVSLPSSTSPLKTLLLTPYSVSTQTEMVPRPLAATRPTRECLFHR